MRKLTKTLGALCIALGLGLAATTVQAADSIKLAVTDIAGLEELQREFGMFKKVLEDETKLDIEFMAVSSRTAAVEALNAKKVDFVLTGPAEYVVMRKRTNSYPIVGFGRPDYFSAIIVMADSGYNLAADLKGQKVAFGDIGSTSNHLAPSQALADYGIDPRADVESLHIARNVAWEALKRGDVAALGMNYGKFLGQRANESELPPGAFKVIARGPDLPNDVLVAGQHVDKGLVETVRSAFVMRSDDLIDAILVGEDNEKYKGMKFLAEIKDADYDYVRSMYRTIGYPEYAQFVGD